MLDMGPPVKILELAEKMIHLSGLSVVSPENPEGDIAIDFTGLRPGEKLYEELLIGRNVKVTEHPMIMCAEEEHLAWGQLKVIIAELQDAICVDDYERIRLLLSATVHGYSSDSEIVDWIYLKNQRFSRVDPSS